MELETAEEEMEEFDSPFASVLVVARSSDDGILMCVYSDGVAILDVGNTEDTQKRCWMMMKREVDQKILMCKFFMLAPLESARFFPCGVSCMKTSRMSQ